MTPAGLGDDQSFPSLNQPHGCYTAPHEGREIAEVVAKLPPDQLAPFPPLLYRIRGPDHAQELDSTAVKLGRLAGRVFAEFKKRAKEP